MTLVLIIQNVGLQVTVSSVMCGKYNFIIKSYYTVHLISPMSQEESGDCSLDFLYEGTAVQNFCSGRRGGGAGTRAQESRLLVLFFAWSFSLEITLG